MLETGGQAEYLARIYFTLAESYCQSVSRDMTSVRSRPKQESDEEVAVLDNLGHIVEGFAAALVGNIQGARDLDDLHKAARLLKKVGRTTCDKLNKAVDDARKIAEKRQKDDQDRFFGPDKDLQTTLGQRIERLSAWGRASLARNSWIGWKLRPSRRVCSGTPSRTSCNPAGRRGRDRRPRLLNRARLKQHHPTRAGAKRRGTPARSAVWRNRRAPPPGEYTDRYVYSTA